MAWVRIMGGLTVFSVYFYHSEEWTERNQQLLEALSIEIRRCPGLWIVAGDFNMEPEIFGQYATPARLPGVLVKPAAPTFRHGASVRCFDYFVVHRAAACQILEVGFLEELGISPHHPVEMKLKKYKGLVASVQATARAVPPPIIGCAREPRCWDFERTTSMDERWARLMQCTEQEILECCAAIGAEARGSAMGDQESGTCEVSQQAQIGQGHGMLESVEQQFARGVVDGSPAHQTAAPTAAVETD